MKFFALRGIMRLSDATSSSPSSPRGSRHFYCPECEHLEDWERRVKQVILLAQVSTTCPQHVTLQGRQTVGHAALSNNKDNKQTPI
eukprot:1086702-Amphidinium_carterae.1